jgi:hypothetical protein
LFRVLDGVLSLSHKKIHAGGNSDRAKQGWARVLVSAVSHTIEFKEEDYEETVATTPEEIRELGKAGWTKYDEITINGTEMHFYRKPKRFGGLKTSL